MTAPNDTRVALASVLGHLNRHLHLTDAEVFFLDGHVRVTPRRDYDQHPLTGLAAWTKTLTIHRVHVTNVHRDDQGGTAFVSTDGAFIDDFPVTVTVLVRDRDWPLLITNGVPVKTGQTIPPHLLMRMCSAEAAEGLPQSGGTR